MSNTKFCVDCRHFVPTGQMCHPDWRRSLVTGAVLDAVPAWNERYMPPGMCGVEGKYWEPYIKGSEPAAPELPPDNEDATIVCGRAGSRNDG